MEMRADPGSPSGKVMSATAAATHLELTMVHEAMLLEYSGRHLAVIELAAGMDVGAPFRAGEQAECKQEGQSSGASHDDIDIAGLKVSRLLVMGHDECPGGERVGHPFVSNARGSPSSPS